LNCFPILTVSKSAWIQRENSKHVMLSGAKHLYTCDWDPSVATNAPSGWHACDLWRWDTSCWGVFLFRVESK